MKKIILMSIAAMLTTGNVYAAEESEVREIPVGTNREEIHLILGTPDSEVLGYKEIYTLSDGSAAVLNYCLDCFEGGFIVVIN